MRIRRVGMSRWLEDALSPSDTVVAAASGDEAAVALLLRSFRPLIRQATFHVLAQYREDAANDICLGLLRSLSSFLEQNPDICRHPLINRKP